MVTLKLRHNLRLAYAGLLDASLVGLFLSDNTQVLENTFQLRNESAPPRLGQGLLQSLEDGDFDCVAVPLEDFAYYVSSRKTTKLKILGCLLGGDTRVIGEVGLERAVTDTRRLGASSPGCALMRFDDLSCALDFEFRCVASWVPQDRMIEAIQMQKFDFLEVNSYWEAVLGLRLGLFRQTFKLQDYGIPASRSHLLVINIENRSVSHEAYQKLRSQLLGAYELVLSETDKTFDIMNSRLKTLTPRLDTLNAHVLSASVRTLMPHFAEAHRTSLSLDWHDLQLFYRWFWAKLAHTSEPWERVPPVSLEHLICDFWS